MAISFSKTEGALGVILEGYSLQDELREDDFGRIRQAFWDQQVLVIRNCRHDDAALIRFTGRFGPLRTVKMDKYRLDHAPEVFIISNVVEDGKHIGVYDAGLFWHTDGPFLETPHGVSALQALEVPRAADGRPLGDTYFSSVTAAYEALPALLKRKLDGLYAHHSMLLRVEKTLRAGRTTDVTSGVPRDKMEWVHPVFRMHPVTGAKCLYISDGYTTRILGLPEDESSELVAELAAHAVAPQFQYRHIWQEGDIVLWDNHGTQHRATFDYALPQRRVMHRTAAMC